MSARVETPKQKDSDRLLKAELALFTIRDGLALISEHDLMSEMPDGIGALIRMAESEARHTLIAIGADDK